MPKKIKNKNLHYKDRNRNNQLNHVTNGGSSSNIKWQNNRIASSNRKNYITPTIIEALNNENDEDVFQNSQNFNPNKKKNKKNRKKKFESLQNSDIVKSVKLSIGEDDCAAKKPLIPSKPFCRLNSMPENVFNILVAYTQNYFTCLDNNREDLIGAYHPNCLFSFTYNLHNPACHRPFRFDDAVLKESRNLKRLTKTDHQTSERKFRLIKQGHLETVNFLAKMPKTEHEPSSFKLDSCFYSASLVSFKISGVFREGAVCENVRPLRSFSKIFICIPDPKTQMSIVNDQYTISNISSQQYNLYFDQKDRDQIKTPIEGNSISTIGIDPKIQMIEHFSNESGLNSEWAKYCLEHAKWNYEEAGRSFVQFKDSIPKEAFKIV
ncbi:nuclear RNA export factor 1 isoform X6 [Brachionus plicatilis]|uniref:Nuclear RNA export factor 1 isoform X6 n=1 Tax=Brachionus plicatilis TaxID=10195 RepID=A0A3M7SVE0_BRAPC|nr:nuclear RNA export factor 1 isoform X6 [Brachionus plicatilis]